MITKEEARAIARAEAARHGVACGPPHTVWGVLRYTVAADTEPIGATVFVRISRRTGRVLSWRLTRWPRQVPGAGASAGAGRGPARSSRG